jgi:hypothetical protein
VGVAQPQREAFRSAAGDIEQEFGLAPALILFGVDVERDAFDVAEPQVVRTLPELIGE